jgi:hypothetical protein
MRHMEREKIGDRRGGADPRYREDERLMGSWEDFVN